MVDVPEGLEVQVLGRPEVRAGGRRLTFRTVRAELLVYALVLAEGGPIEWLELAARFWPDSRSGPAAHRLRTTLWEARTALGSHGDRLRREERSLFFHMADVTVDLREEVARAERAVRASDPSSLAEAVRRLSRPLLEGHDEDWVLVEDEQRRAVLRRFADELVRLRP